MNLIQNGADFCIDLQLTTVAAYIGLFQKNSNQENSNTHGSLMSSLWPCLYIVSSPLKIMMRFLVFKIGQRGGYGKIGQK